MSVFDLDEQGRKQLDEQAVANPLDLSKVKPGFFEGLGSSIFSGTMRGGARAGTAVLTAGVVPVAARDDYLSSFMTDDVADFLQAQGVANPARGATTAGQDAYFADVVEGIGQRAVDAWTPDPTETGTAGRVLGGLAEIVLPLAAAGGNPSLLAATEGIERPASLVKQGVGAGTAQAVGLAGSVGTLAGFKLPAAFGSTLTQRLATGAAGNLLLGAGVSGVQYAALQAGGNAEQAKAFDPLDVEARAVDALTGLAFGALAHATAPRVPLEQRDALLTARNADRFQRTANDPLVADEGAAIRGQDALQDALEQLARGEPVNVVDTIRPSDFLLPMTDQAPAPAAATLGGYQAFRRALESGGRADARNPESSALGIDQFTAGTWRRMVAKTKPEWAQGLDDAQLLALRADPARSTEMVAALDAENAAGLRAEGLPVDAYTLYAAHHFGLAGGRRFARSDGATPMERILSRGQLEANPYLRGLTKDEAVANWNQRAKRAGVLPDGGLVDTDPAGQALRERLVTDPDKLLRDYAALEDSDGGRVLNTDTARELSPEYLADRTRSADVHEAASDTIKLLYEQKLAQPTPEGFDSTVLFTAGGTGAGKTSGMKAMGDSIGRPEIIYDTNMNTLSSAVDKIEQALAAGRDVDIVYVYRDPVDALVNGAIPRAQRQAERYGSGRTVPLREHARTHAGVRPTIEAIAARYADDPRVKVTAIDNSQGKGKQKVVDLASLPRVEEDSLHGSLQDALDQARTGGLAEDLYRGFRGPGSGAPAALAGDRAGNGPSQGRAQGSPGREAGSRGEVSPAPETPLDAARQLAAQNPDASIVVGADADGGAVHRTVADEVADIEADLARATTDATAFQAAVNCFLRRG
ncbi:MULTISPECIES: zeta toxin family protein [unclassified Stenotrophomonas]|uniref:zeta toxin family protein n=1 Tax=unclassified Stenotrophomonas TaxID=196198 RepID=UPI00244BCA81|nr:MULTISPECIES: zeta toxin family protein [unclassified Stenotrophomonas]MDH1243215.1 zeta toxin family protein [Stenotrophomonas sp. GD03948]MDH1577501.1 zeta toxin family protein [Stenotrophomonas sp. GD03744]